MIFVVCCNSYFPKPIIMQELQNLEMSALYDMLATQTEVYMKLVTGGASEEEFTTCKTTITLLQAEIETRRQTITNTTATDSNINFTSDTTE